MASLWSICNVLVMGVKVSEDPDAQCTRKHKSQQAGRGRNPDNLISRGTKAKGKKVFGEDTEIGSKPGSQI